MLARYSAVDKSTDISAVTCAVKGIQADSYPEKLLTETWPRMMQQHYFK